MAVHRVRPLTWRPTLSSMAQPGQLQSRSCRARERILDTAYDLFSRHGIRAVGVDWIIESSGVAKMSPYRNFESKDALVIAFLERREERWTKGVARGRGDRAGRDRR